MNQTLVRPGRYTIGFQVNQLDSSYGNQVWPGAYDLALDKDVNLIFFPGRSHKSPYRYEYHFNSIYRFISPKNIDALIMVSSTLGQRLDPQEFKNRFLKPAPFPIVSIGDKIPGITSVLVDNKNGVREAIAHLVEKHRFRRIAFVRGPEINTEADERYLAYLESLEHYGISSNENLVYTGDFYHLSGEDAVRTLLVERKMKVDAIFFSNDDMAIGGMRELTRLGYKVPKDIAVIGFDDVEESRFTAPPLTTVRQPLYEQSRKALECALDLLDKKVTEQSITLPTRLTIRSSCGCFPDALNWISLNDEPSGQKAPSKLLFKDLDQDKFAREILSENPSIKIYYEKQCGPLSRLIRILRDNSIQSDETADEFLSELQLAITEEMQSGQDTSSWQTTLSLLYRKISPYYKNVREERTAETLFRKAAVLTGELNLLRQVNEMTILNRRMFEFKEMLLRLHSSRNVEDLISVMEREFALWGLDSFVIALYEPFCKKEECVEISYPERFKVLFGAVDGKTVVSHASYSSEIIAPDDLLPMDRRSSMILEPLFFSDTLFGIFLIEIKSRFLNHFELLAADIGLILNAVLVKPEK